MQFLPFPFAVKKFLGLHLEYFSRQLNEESSSTRWLYWSKMKDRSICFRKKLCLKHKNNFAFHPGPVQPPSGEGSPLVQASGSSTKDAGAPKFNFWYVAIL